jgi:MOSC domain-containing protein YiiM
METKMGRIVGLCISRRPGIPKYPVTMSMLDQFGLYGDYHNNPTRKDFNNPHGPRIPNTDRHITIVAQEALSEINQELGIHLTTGSLAENILTEGLGNLSDILSGSIITIGETVRLEVIKQNKPCQNTAPIHPLFNSTIYNQSKRLFRRGLLCKIIHGKGEMIFLGGHISVHPPDTPNE